MMATSPCVVRTKLSFTYIHNITKPRVMHWVGLLYFRDILMIRIYINVFFFFSNVIICVAVFDLIVIVR